MKIKICGLKTSAALDTCITCGADMAGFVFFAKSPRFVDLQQAQALARQATGRIETVALVVDASDETLADIVASLNPDVLQLHGAETPARVAEIRTRFGRPVMKAFGIATASDITHMLQQADVPDRLLLDAKPSADAILPGGNGLCFDWHLLEALQLPKPWLLSGGLNPDNVAEALRLTRAPGVDVSSGVESRPGEKDLARIAAFVAAARNAPLP
ncbi:MAG: phosphoribosylanthranilate isomerase [Hyphomicrobiales bacterium]|nr:phosphoribosylanthranilate isomerase [Hyphomicrobiales bacterium]MDE2115723.1 phosphoribosylanthranilate isomerase [Hyphomicrobiales bacterium]